MPEACASHADLATLGVIASHETHWELARCKCAGGSQCITCVLLRVSVLRISLGAGASCVSHWASLHCTPPAGAQCITTVLLGAGVSPAGRALPGAGALRVS